MNRFGMTKIFIRILAFNCLMIDLKKSSGLPIKLKDNSLVFGPGMEKVEADIRTRKQMLAVLKNPDAPAPDDFYYMYRNVRMQKDEKKIAANNLRYDITVLPAFMSGDEYNKTFGHYHPKKQGTETWYPEVYEVLHGRAHYLLQDENATRFCVYEARAGDKCVMMPGFGHITVNPSRSETLVMANWVYPGFKSLYDPIEEFGGAALFETEKGFIPNGNYARHMNIKLIFPKKFPEFGLTQRPIYTEGIKDPKKFNWLVNPEKYQGLFEKYLEG